MGTAQTYTVLSKANARDENHEIVIEIFISKKNKHIIFTIIFIILLF